ncbi:uncharacterized protein LOC111351609 [Spodoptera litura]|uniref:RNA-directed DNA polymerase n=1 Tax=Spodoptera litura TaxID=69820 RepID=A0A9J7DZD6_SPOLT|nr:uncharacterized protein LOC111351609 [Spodoptera litura]
MSDTNIDMSCDPANPRRSLVSGPASVKYVTEDCTGVGDQAPATVNTTGSTTKKLTQQVFHPSLFIARPRSSSLENIKAIDSVNQPNTPSVMINTIKDSDNKACPPPWQRVPTDRNPKRKRFSNSPPQTATEITTSNRFSELPIDLTDDTTENPSTHVKKSSKPPPIILYGIEDLTKLTELLNNTVPSDSYSYKIINRDQLRVMTRSTEIYKDLIELIRNNGLIGHTFTQKQKKCYRIVIKNLHHTTPKSAITEAIENTGNKVRGEIVCGISRKNKKPLNMFFVNIEPGPNNTVVKSIQTIFHTRVTIEDPRKTNEIPQCTRCQQYGHTKNNCMRPYRCVKCGQGHRTTDCLKKDRNSPATCALCLGDHPANYKGCQVYKEIRSRKMIHAGNRNFPLVKTKATDTFNHKIEDFPPLKLSRYTKQQSTNKQEINTLHPPEFLRKEVTYLGHIIGQNGVQPNPDKVRAVTEFPTPKSPKDIKSFLGLVSYYRRFIQDFSKLAKPLTNLLKKDVPFIWENTQQLSFESLKDKLVSAPVLAYPDFSQPFILTCDASNYAISAILSQGQISQDRPIAFASRTMNKAECNYSVTEKECLAILFGTKVFRPYLYGNRFSIVTDHKPLQWLFNCKDPGSRLIRWRLKLEEFEYDIKYKKGKINSNADALSRFPVNPVQPESTSNSESKIENEPSQAVDKDLMDLLISPPSFDPETLNSPTSDPLALNDNDLLPFPEIKPIPESSEVLKENTSNHLPSTTRCSPTSDSPAAIPLAQQPDDNTEIINDLPDLSDDNYPAFLRALARKDNTSFNTIIQEHNEDISKSKYKIIILPTSIDLDESNPYVQNIMDNIPNSSEIISKERSLNSFISFENKDKLYYLLFFKVHHFDKSEYPDIYESLRTIRNELVIKLDLDSKPDISITDFKNPFDSHQYVKIYNMLLYLFNNSNINVHVYKGSIIYPSSSEIPKILRENHDIPIAGHLGSNRMLKRIQENFYWKNMRTDIENFVKKCVQCQTNKALRQINRAPMQITSTSTQPFQRISLDIVGPLPEAGPAKLRYILTIQDDLTKFSSAYPIRTTTAEETSECLLHYISIFGIPKMILTDQGTNFTSDLFRKTCEFLKIKNLWSSPYHPQTQGALERSHSTLKEYLRSFVNEEQSNWPRYVYTAMLTYNTSVHSTTNFTPFELTFGSKPLIPNSIYDEAPGATYPDYVRMLQNRLKYCRDKALDSIRRSKESSKNYYDTRTRPAKYKVGDYVYLKNHLRMRKALSPQWKGPYKVIRINGNNTLTLLINRRHVIHHYDQVKLAEAAP